MRQVRYPADWQRRRLKFVAKVSTSNVDKHIHDDEIQIRLCNYTDVYYNRVITEELELTAGSVTPHELDRFGLRRGQVLMTKDSESWDDIAVPAFVTKDMPDVVCGYHLAIIEPLGEELDGEFFCWAAQTDSINDHYKIEARGITRFGLGHYALKNVEIGYPRIEQQRAISDHLRLKTEEIDDLIEKKRGLLELLAEKRSALITRAVTKGLDPNASMKPSGIDWLGDIPAHWDVMRLRRLAKPFIGLTYSPDDVVSDGEGTLVLRASNIQNARLAFDDNVYVSCPIPEKLRLRAGDVLVCSRNGSRHLIGKCALIDSNDKSWTFGAFTTVIRSEFGYFLYWVFNSSVFKFQSGRFLTSTINQLTIGTFKSIEVPFPPKDEQDKIIAAIAKGTAELDKSAELVEQAIHRLAEYRSAIITKAVIGELEIA